MGLPGRHRAGQHRADVQRPVLGPARVPAPTIPFGVFVFNVTTLVSRVPSLGVQGAHRRPLPVRPQRGAEGRDPRRLPGGARPAVPEGQGRRARPASRPRSPTSGRSGSRTSPGNRAAKAWGHPRSELIRRADPRLRGLHHVAARRAERPLRPAVPDPHRRRRASRGPTRCSWST